MYNKGRIEIWEIIFLKFEKLLSNYFTKLSTYARHKYEIFENFGAMLLYLSKIVTYNSHFNAPLSIKYKLSGNPSNKEFPPFSLYKVVIEVGIVGSINIDQTWRLTCKNNWCTLTDFFQISANLQDYDKPCPLAVKKIISQIAINSRRLDPYLLLWWCCIVVEVVVVPPRSWPSWFSFVAARLLMASTSFDPKVNLSPLSRQKKQQHSLFSAKEKRLRN